jgi:hypothetical protein
MRKHGAELHAQTTRLWGSLVNVAKLPERTVWLDLVPNARVRVDVGQFAPNEQNQFPSFCVTIYFDGSFSISRGGEMKIVVLFVGTQLTERFDRQRRTGTPP